MERNRTKSTIRDHWKFYFLLMIRWSKDTLQMDMHLLNDVTKEYNCGLLTSNKVMAFIENQPVTAKIFLKDTTMECVFKYIGSDNSIH
ncbi:unnamed protein product [Acanthoscelides obtectus]|uniref:Uncharacterized protein n=1 Tax=Acanthoscelides obtectus TaxID=200917 RepID=A0A9P0PN20_ACAOB|nr:unnamed protein product [Acanthoscelides obtectus]CAK1663179.1 hypothetical protein AOBTE_LOCUS23536 [Acanthoscelides obtectus]